MLADLVGDRRSFEQPFQQGTQIETGATGKQWQTAAYMDGGDSLEAIPGKGGGAVVRAKQLHSQGQAGIPGGQGGGLLQSLGLCTVQVQPAADVLDGNVLRVLLAGGVQFINGLCAQAVHRLLIFAAQLVQ